MANTIVDHTRLNDVQSALLRAVQNRQLSTHGILMSNNKYYTFHQEHVLNHGSKKYYDVKVTPKDNHFWTGSVLGTLKKFFATMVATVLVIRTRDLVAQELADEQRYDLLVKAQYLHSLLDELEVRKSSGITLCPLGTSLERKIESGNLDCKLGQIMKHRKHIGQFCTSNENMDFSLVIKRMLLILQKQLENTFQKAKPSESDWQVVHNFDKQGNGEFEAIDEKTFHELYPSNVLTDKESE